MTRRREAQFIAVLLAEDLMAVKALFMERQPDSIVCLSDVTADRLDYRSAFELFAHDPSVAARMAFQLGEDERRLHNWNIGLGCADARERIAFMFVELYGRLKRLRLLREEKSFTCPMTQEQIGDRVGMTTVHVNRVLGRFRQDGILTMQSRKVTIGNLSELARIAEPLFDTFEKEAPEFRAALFRGSAQGKRDRRPPPSGGATRRSARVPRRGISPAGSRIISSAGHNVRLGSPMRM